MIAYKLVMSATTRAAGPSDSHHPPPAVADYTAQALVSTVLFSHFPTDQIVGEEDSSELNTPENAVTKAQIVRLANESMTESLSDGEGFWAEAKKVVRNEKEWLAIIDRGNSEGGATGRESCVRSRQD